MKIMVSACLAGENCKYNGGNNRNKKVLRLMTSYTACSVRGQGWCGHGQRRPDRG